MTREKSDNSDDLHGSTSRHSVLQSAITHTLYEQMKPIAASILGNSAGHTLQPTAIVNETYIKLAGNPDLQFNDRAHFVCIAAKAMRHILADHARKKMSKKRGGQFARLTLSGIGRDDSSSEFDAADVHYALEKLERLSARQSRVVELRFFAGMSISEIAEVTETSGRTTQNDWRFAKAWLRQELGSTE